MELRLPTIAVPVRLAIVGASPADAELFVADVPRTGRGKLIEDLAAVLDEPAGWVPVRQGARVRLLGKHAIAWIAVRRRDEGAKPSTDFSEEPSEVTMLYDHQHAVEVELASGGRLHGTLLDSSPADRSRVIDHLNARQRFVRLWTPDEHYLISTSQITAVMEL